MRIPIPRAVVIVSLVFPVLEGDAAAEDRKKCSEFTIQLGFCGSDGYEQGPLLTEAEWDLLRNATAEDFAWVEEFNAQREPGSDLTTADFEREMEKKKLELEQVLRDNPQVFEVLLVEQEPPQERVRTDISEYSIATDLDLSRPPSGIQGLALKPKSGNHVLKRLESPALKTPEGRQSARRVLDRLKLEDKPTGTPRPVLTKQPRLDVTPADLPDGVRPISAERLSGPPPIASRPGAQNVQQSGAPVPVTPTPAEEASWTDWMWSWVSSDEGG